MAIKTNPKLVHLDAERMKRRGDKPMDSAETINEFEFLLDAGTHPLLAADMIGVPYVNLQKMAQRLGRTGLFDRIDIHEWIRFEHDNRIPSRWVA